MTRRPAAGPIDRSRPLRFTFDGVRDRLAGDTLASALLANGVHVVGAASTSAGRAASCGR